MGTLSIPKNAILISISYNDLWTPVCVVKRIDTFDVPQGIYCHMLSLLEEGDSFTVEQSMLPDTEGLKKGQWTELFERGDTCKLSIAGYPARTDTRIWHVILKEMIFPPDRPVAQVTFQLYREAERIFQLRSAYN